MSGTEKLQFEHAQILHLFGLGVEKSFKENFVNIAKEVSVWVEDVHVDPPLPPYMNEVLSEERASFNSLELMK